MTAKQAVETAMAMVDAFVNAGKIKPVLPPGGRDGVISTLTHLMADSEALKDYAATLEAEQERQGVRDMLLEQPGLDIPDARIAEEGFGCLSDDELADFALCPEALFAINKYLWATDACGGGWLIDAVLDVEAARLVREISYGI